jgi:hypothetical protein
MGLRDMLERVGCVLGRHADEWIWTGDGSCAMARTCSWCGKIWPSITEHRFTAWAYTASDDTTSCLMEHHCLRCGLSKEDTRHNPRKHYLSPGKCEMQSFCTRCGNPIDPAFVRHKIAWRYLVDLDDPPSGLKTAPMLGCPREDYCRGRESCLRCGAKCAPEESRHVWEGRTRVYPQQKAQSIQQPRTCGRCGFVEPPSTEH